MTVEKRTVSKTRSLGAPGKQGLADDGKRFPAMDVVVACVSLLKREEVWRRGGSRSTLIGGMRIFV